jgi:hypothetical protein
MSTPATYRRDEDREFSTYRLGYHLLPNRDSAGMPATTSGLSDFPRPSNANKFSLIFNPCETVAVSSGLRGGENFLLYHRDYQDIVK